MENATSFQDAKTRLQNTVMLAPAYFILGGNSSGQVSSFIFCLFHFSLVSYAETRLVSFNVILYPYYFGTVYHCIKIYLVQYAGVIQISLVQYVDVSRFLVLYNVYQDLFGIECKVVA